MLLDTGAEVTVISKQLAATLASPKQPGESITLTGIGRVKSLYAIPLHLYGDERVGKGDHRILVTAHVLEKIPQPNLENVDPSVQNLPFLADAPLADEERQSSRPIDIILDIQAYYHSHMASVKISPDKGIIADKTVFGWVVGGTALKADLKKQPPPKCYKISNNEPDLQELLERQWKMDQAEEEKPHFSMEEAKAHHHFNETHQRLPDGRYEVELPRMDDPLILGESRHQAEVRYRSVEKTMKRKGMWKAYHAAIQDFINQGHAASSRSQQT